MAASSGNLFKESSFVNLKQIGPGEVRREAADLLISGERLVAAFKTVRDQVIFTNKRIIVINAQGITGKKTSYLSYPFSKVQYFGVETAGVLDFDSELILAFSDGASLSFDFRANVDIRQISAVIAEYVL